MLTVITFLYTEERGIFTAWYETKQQTDKNGILETDTQIL